DPAVASRFADCKPMNILGVDPSVATPDGYAYAIGTSSWEAETTQDIVALSLTGVAFELPAGPVDFAVGAEYREEELTLDSNADPALLDTPEEYNERFNGLRGVASSALFYWLNNVGVADGDRDVTEVFVELNVPLLSGVPGAQNLDLNAAWRWTDYSTSGDVDTWKVGLQWRPIDDILVRVAQSTDIRAPSLYDMFAGRSSAIGTFYDPVTDFQTNIQQASGGNPNLSPEESDTFTAGFVWTPGFVDGLSLSVDYYSLEVDDAIDSLTGQQIINNCYNYGGVECSLITRPDPNSFPTSIFLTKANIATLEVSGLDIDLTYSTDAIGPGQFSARLYMNHLMKYETQLYQGAPVIDYVGIAEADSVPEGRPEWTGLLSLSYQLGDLGIHLTEQYIHSVEVGLPGTNSYFIEDDVDAVWYTDLTVTYDVAAGDGSIQLFGTVNNLFDEDFPLIPATVPGVNMPTTISVYDTIGRAFTVGMRFDF
ncbi:MAG: TonB-dependent receptor, partial [Parahaliea sp.]